MSGRKLLDHHHGEQSNCELQQLNKKVDGVTKQTIPLIPLLLCLSQGCDLWLIHRLSQSGGTKGDFRQRSDRAEVNENSDWSLSQRDRTILLPVSFSVLSLMCVWLKLTTASTPLDTSWSRCAVLGNCCSCCRKRLFTIDIREKSKQTAVTSVISVCASQCVCDSGWMDGWGRLAGSLPLANMLHHCELRQTQTVVVVV